MLCNNKKKIVSAGQRIYANLETRWYRKTLSRQQIGNKNLQIFIGMIFVICVAGCHTTELATVPKLPDVPSVPHATSSAEFLINNARNPEVAKAFSDAILAAMNGQNVSYGANPILNEKELALLAREVKQIQVSYKLGENVSQTISSVNTAPEDAPALTWNVWMERDKKRIVSLVIDEIPDVNLNLSKYLFSETSGVQASASFKQTMVNAIEEKQSSLRIVVHAFLLGGGIDFGPGAIREQSIDIDLDRISDSNSKEFQETKSLANSSIFPSKAFADLAKKFEIASFKIPIKATTNDMAGKCAQIAFSIWNEGDFRPLDYIVYTFPVVTDSHRLDIPKCSAPSVQGGFGSMAGSLNSQGNTRADAALQFFEYDSDGLGPQTRVVYVDVAKHASSESNSKEQSRGVFSWQLNGSIGKYIGSKSQQDLIQAARQSGNYVDVANELKQKIFPKSSDDSLNQASEAFDSLSHLPTHDGQNPTVLVRGTMANGQLVYAPLAILQAGGEIKQSFNLIYPLPRENYSASSCIGRWALGYPDEMSLGGTVPDKLPWDDATMALSPDRVFRLHNINDLTCYLDSNASNCVPVLEKKLEPSQSEALLLLAHQSDGFLWFSNTTDKLSRFLIDSNTRKFPPGSAAIISACSVLNQDGNNQQILRRLNGAGIDAMVVSPFFVDATYGKLLSQAIIRVVKAAYDKGESLSLLSIYNKAADLITNESGNADIGQMRYEFVVLGNHQSKLCKQ